MKNIAIILAGGSGSRFHTDIPKQFLKVAGLSVMEHTIAVFQHHELIDEIAIVAHEMYHEKIDEFVVHNGFIKVKKILSSGTERHLSSLSAIRAYENDDDCNLIFHDAVRPLISQRIITDVVETLKTYNAVDVAIPSSDTIIQVNEVNEICNIPQRKMLRRGQTPQGFKCSTIKQAYELALQDPNFATTDDCGVVLKYLPEIKIAVVEGDDINMKLTYKEDFYLIEKLFQLRTSNFTNHTISEEERQKFANKVLVVFGASSGIGFDLCKICRKMGVRVYGFSRSLNGIDISNAENVAAALKSVAEKEQTIDFVVDTASVLYKMPLIHIEYEKIAESIAINYNGMVNVAKESFKYLKASHGQLLFYTSSSYTRGRMNYSIYSSTKCATVNFIQALAEEWSSLNIRVNCINPERTKTPMRMKNFGIEPENTLLQSEDVAIVSAKVLLSDLTGQVVDVKIKDI